MLFGTVANADGLSFITKRNASKKQKVAVLMYHMISEIPEYQNTYCISPEELEKDIIYFKNNNYIFAHLSEIDSVCKANPNKNVAVLTFDDGYESDYKYVLPLLKKHNAKATFFVFASQLDKPFYMTKSQLKALSESPYAIIGNHSYDIHNKTPREIRELYAYQKNSDMIVNDFSKNKSVLENITNKKITVLSYPNGIYNNTVDNYLKNKKICSVSVSTDEKPYSPYNKIIGRYNRSNTRTAQNIASSIR